MDPRAQSFLIGLGWGGGIASIILNSLYQKPIIGPFDLLLLLLLGTLAGIILASASRAIPIAFLSITLSAILSYVVLSIPAISGSLGSSLVADLLYGRNAVAVFRNLVFPPYVLFACLTGSLIGAYLAERWDLAE